VKAKLLAVGAAVLIAVPAAFAGGSSHAAKVSITVYASGDVNVQSLWQDNLIPGFKKTPDGKNVNVKFIFSEHATNDGTTLARIGAAVKQRKWSGFDLLDGGLVTTLAVDGLNQPVSKATAPNLKHINPDLLKPVKGAALPYRGSSVVLAYNSKYVSSPPKTLQALLAWIKANPGKFTYNSPNSGGSGYSFAETVVDSTLPAGTINTMQTGDTYDPSIESAWKQGFSILHGLNSYTYSKGVYPNGNQAVLDLLAKEQIWVAPVWSDQALTGLKTGTLPSSIKLTQISNPSFNGGAAYLGVPKTARNKQTVYKFVNYILSPKAQQMIVNVMAGYPAIDIKYMGNAIKQKFEDVAANVLRRSYATKYNNDFKAQWQQNVP
jgi:putative spermidine/putrescine transport system substrate-binding protein